MKLFGVTYLKNGGIQHQQLSKQNCVIITLVCAACSLRRVCRRKRSMTSARWLLPPLSFLSLRSAPALPGREGGPAGGGAEDGRPRSSSLSSSRGMSWWGWAEGRSSGSSSSAGRLGSCTQDKSSFQTMCGFLCGLLVHFARKMNI